MFRHLFRYSEGRYDNNFSAPNRIFAVTVLKNSLVSFSGSSALIYIHGGYWQELGYDGFFILTDKDPISACITKWACCVDNYASAPQTLMA